MSTVKSYFDNHGHQHVYHKDPDVYNFIIQFLKKRSFSDNKMNVLDVGCGDGSFLKSLINSNIEAAYYGTDVSNTMVYGAKSSINNKSVNLFISDGFHMPFSDSLRFDLIHLDSVIHHLIGKTVSDSQDLADKILRILMRKLKNEGSLILEELYYDSYIYPSLTSKLIFYGLKISNSLNIDIGRIINEYHKGLEVRFLHEDEIVKMLKEYGAPNLIKRISCPIPTSYKFFLLKKLGHVAYIITKNDQ